MWSVFLLALAVNPGPRDGQDNLWRFALPDGGGELEWVSPCTFRVSRYWGKREPTEPAISTELVPVARTDRGSSARFVTDCVTVEVDKSTLRIEVAGKDRRVLSDAAPPGVTGRGFIVERAAYPGERFFGLGPRPAPDANLRGKRVEAVKPLLISSLGYGEYFPPGSVCTYELASSAPDRRRVLIQGTDQIEYFIHYGPSPREVFSEHAGLVGSFTGYDPPTLGLLRPADVPGAATRISLRGAGSWTSLQESLQSLAHASWSALLLPALDLAPYEAGPDALFRRAVQLGTAVPLLYSPAAGRTGGHAGYAAALDFRKRLAPYLATCAYEARQFGYPMIRPIAMQSPGDLQAAGSETTEFMLGDALLVAPIFEPSGRRTVYLPAGTWTDLRTNQIHKGRQTISIQTSVDELPLFAKHVSILPLASLDEPNTLSLHYFAGRAAEYLLMEADGNGVSQFHAAPAGDLIRLEIASARKRTYEWVIRHAGPASGVTSGDSVYGQVASLKDLRPGTWFYDRAGERIHIRTDVSASQERIIHVTPR